MNTLLFYLSSFAWAVPSGPTVTLARSSSIGKEQISWSILKQKNADEIRYTANSNWPKPSKTDVYLGYLDFGPNTPNLKNAAQLIQNIALIAQKNTDRKLTPTEKTLAQWNELTPTSPHQSTWYLNTTRLRADASSTETLDVLVHLLSPDSQKFTPGDLAQIRYNSELKTCVATHLKTKKEIKEVKILSQSKSQVVCLIPHWGHAYFDLSP